LDPDFFIEAKRANLVAALSNTKAATVSSSAWLIETQVKAVIDAAQEIGIIKLSAEIKKELIQHLQHMTLRVVNLN
jgi:hypothetical protein